MNLKDPFTNSIDWNDSFSEQSLSYSTILYIAGYILYIYLAKFTLRANAIYDNYVMWHKDVPETIIYL